LFLELFVGGGRGDGRVAVDRVDIVRNPGHLVQLESAKRLFG
jgi:hypothetical protein